MIVLMGVAGSGKTVVGKALASRLGWPFLEGDDFHPFANVEKMSRGIPLTDSDREPWLDALGREMAVVSGAGSSAVVACSALRAIYRERLLEWAPGARFVHLQVGKALLRERLEDRKGHFVDERLLESQLSILEAPAAKDTLLVDASRPVTEIVEEIGARSQLFAR
ncbi:MAG: gluconokinase [Fibrobacterota bacterium]